jgi:glycine cleavage system H protein
MPSPADCLFSDSHEWHKLDRATSVLTLGITQFAVNQLTDVTYVSMKPKGTKVAAGGAVGEVESVKTTSDIYCAAAGEIIEVNQAAVNDPSLLNTDPYGKGWLVKIKIESDAGLKSLKDSKSYDAAHPL